MRLAILNFLVISVFTFSNTLIAEKKITCEHSRPIRFAGLTWDSNSIITEVVRIIAEKGFGCKTVTIPGASIPLLTGLAKGSLDVMMEVWTLNVDEAWSKFKKHDKLRSAGVVFKGAKQGFYVPRYLVAGDPARGIEAKAPKLRRVRELTDYKHLFADPEKPEKGRFFNCILGWGCEIVNTNKLKAYGLEKSYVNFRPGAEAALFAAIKTAYAKGEGFVSYLWEPHWLMTKIDVVKLEEPPFDPKIWKNLSRNDPRPPLQGVAYPDLDVEIGIHSPYQRKAPVFVDFLRKVQFPMSTVNAALSHLVDKKVTHREAALHFLRTQPTVWRNWLDKWRSDAVWIALQSLAQN